MSSSHRNEIPTSEPYPCPTCGAETLVTVVEDCKLQDGYVMKRLRHLKCKNCGEILFDNTAMDRIAEERKKHQFKSAA